MALLLASAQRRSKDSPGPRPDAARTKEVGRAPQGAHESFVCSCALGLRICDRFHALCSVSGTSRNSHSPVHRRVPSPMARHAIKEGDVLSERRPPSSPIAEKSSSVLSREFPSCRLLKADNAPFQSDGQGSERSNESRGLTEPRPDACAPRFGSVRRLSVDHGTHLTGRVAVVHRSRSSCRERRRPWPQALDPTQDLGEQGARYRHFR